jgi:leader peptidase (prepilin peptidase) / N-methyltransferase
MDALMIFPFDHWAWWAPVFLIGACIGSFLNVVIYRVPLGLSVNEPKRSFCPHCKAPIPMMRNIPLISWLLLRGKCADCGAPIAIRYFLVELLTALLFITVWLLYPPQAAGFLCVMMALLVAITFIDAEHLVIPVSLTWAGSALGVIACMTWPPLVAMGGIAADDWISGLRASAIGWAAGFFGLWAVVELGKMAFGKKALTFENPVDWSVREPQGDHEPMCFVIDGEAIAWWDIFSRKTDRLVVDCESIRVDGRPLGGGRLEIRAQSIVLPDGSEHGFADLVSLDGRATSAVIPREAMGMGDIHLLGMIGAFFGWPGVVFSLFAASFFALGAAAIGRIGFGKQLPFGPFLAMGCCTWAFGGWEWWRWYFDFLFPITHLP